MDYIADANRTASNAFNGDLVSKGEFVATVHTSVNTLVGLDRIKKLLFYGADPVKGRIPTVQKGHATCENLLVELSKGDMKPDETGLLLHGIIGAATETGELLETIGENLYGDKPFDLVNIKEEVGDIMWYLAVIAKACGFTFEECQQVNIDKLRQRFPNAFTSDAANNRNLEAERKVLEGK